MNKKKYCFRTQQVYRMPKKFPFSQTPKESTPQSFVVLITRQGKVGDIFLYILAILFSLSSTSCKKLVSIPEPVNTITTAETFSADAQANSTMSGIYANMMNNGLVFSDGAISIYSGLSADELVDLFSPTANPTAYQFFKNDILYNNSNITTYFWKPAYFAINQANSIISGIASSTGMSDSAKKVFTGEAKFVRAFCYFYLTNLFGNVPLVLTTDFNQTALLARADQAIIYQNIIQDLKDAQGLLLEDFSVGKGERIRPNKWAATALLARVYLFTQKYDSAITQANSVINNNQYNLVDLNNVFNKNSLESIWQLQQDISYSPYNATLEGLNYFIPKFYPNINPSVPVSTNLTRYMPSLSLSNELVNSFDSGDLRKQVWVGNTSATTGSVSNGTVYYFALKYILGSSTVPPFSSNTAPPQYYTVLRLGEQYLIRAEAEANSPNGISAAISDLNIIRARAQLLPYAGPSDQTSVINAIMHERQVELFCEWGHRWFDLKRWDVATQVLTANKGFPVNINSLLLPIPSSEIQIDYNLIQNPGY